LPLDLSLETPRFSTRRRRVTKEFISSARKVRSFKLSLKLRNFIEERLKKLQESLKKKGFEQVPSEVQRAQETLTLIFKQFDLDPIANKALYDTLVDWKRTI
jgi:broad specificity phosphatase PhoE